MRRRHWHIPITHTKMVNPSKLARLASTSVTLPLSQSQSSIWHSCPRYTQYTSKVLPIHKIHNYKQRPPDIHNYKQSPPNTIKTILQNNQQTMRPIDNSYDCALAQFTWRLTTQYHWNDTTRQPTNNETNRQLIQCPQVQSHDVACALELYNATCSDHRIELPANWPQHTICLSYDAKQNTNIGASNLQPQIFICETCSGTLQNSQQTT